MYYAKGNIAVKYSTKMNTYNYTMIDYLLPTLKKANKNKYQTRIKEQNFTSTGIQTKAVFNKQFYKRTQQQNKRNFTCNPLYLLALY